MLEKDTKKYYLDEDILLLMLAVLDYPSGSKNIFSFDELKATGFEKISNKKIFDWVFDFMSSNKIVLDAFSFEGVQTWDDYKGKKFDLLVPYMKERPLLLEQTARILNFKIKINKSAQNKLLKTLERYVTFFINGKFLAGAFPYQFFKEIIDKELAKARGKR